MRLEMKVAMQTGKWIRICLLNLFLVALLGVVLRYKIAFSLPFIDQRNLLHAHSHFAFAGWISQSIPERLGKQLFIPET